MSEGNEGIEFSIIARQSFGDLEICVSGSNKFELVDCFDKGEAHRIGCID